MPYIREFIAVGSGGFIGVCLRFMTIKAIKLTGASFPFATLISNVVAGLAIGFIIGYENDVKSLNHNLELFISTGLLGGLSTFSTFSLETVHLFSENKYGLAFSNILLNLILSFGALVIGMAIAKSIFKRV